MKRFLYAILLCLLAVCPASAQDMTQPQNGEMVPQYQTPPPISAAPVYSQSATPIIIPTQEPAPKKIVLPPPKVDLQIAPEVSQMVKDYNAAVARMQPEQKRYIEGIVAEGHKIDEPLHDMMIKTLDWGICASNGLMDIRTEEKFKRYSRREEQIYKENMSAFEHGVLAGLKGIDPAIVKGKITAQGIISMTAMKQLYQIEEAKASPEKIKYDCETLKKFVDEYNARNMF